MVMRNRFFLWFAALVLFASGCAFIADGADHDAIYVDGDEGDASDQDAVATPTDVTGTGQQLPPQGIKLLLPWLKAKKYAAWQAESKVHESAGPHDHTRVFLNDPLAASFSKGMYNHPVGAAAVKEIFAEDMKTRRGWSVSLKLQANSANGDGWYWFESLSLDGSSGVYADGVGTSLCTECHLKGADQVMTKWPLE